MSEIIHKSVLLEDYKRIGTLPTMDALLDWRSRLSAIKSIGKYPDEWYNIEIAATDELLKKHDR